jgi:hypothetical protein
MNVLVACESSGRVRSAFRKFGEDAWSCDLKPDVAGSEFHLQEDCESVIAGSSWDLIVMHPPCTAIAVSGNRWYGRGQPRNAERLSAVKWTLDLWELAVKNSNHVCMENPVGVLPIKATQYIQPFQFGHPESKKTGLWLFNLPKLQPTNILEKPECGFWNNQTPSGQNKLGPSPERATIRAVTYDGVAEAMAKQWR